MWPRGFALFFRKKLETDATARPVRRLEKRSMDLVNSAAAVLIYRACPNQAQRRSIGRKVTCFSIPYRLYRLAGNLNRR